MTLEEMIKAMCDRQGISMTQLGARVGLSQAGFSKRVKVGKFTQEELKIICNEAHCDYHSYFLFDDGTEI